jgi:small neutral amino acid transporter SnatA (MarC family)
MSEFLHSATLLLLLLNPFLVIVYLIDVMQKLDRRRFRHVLIRAGLIAGTVFCIFAILGDIVFSEIMQVEFASFQIFGGVVFLLIGLQFVFQGPTAIQMLRGESQHLAGAIAMPVLIGPGTISASVVVGKRLDPLPACLAVVLAVLTCICAMLLLKAIHDHVRPRNEKLVQRYIEVTGRITALYIGTVSVEMVMQGLRAWAVKF